MNNNSNTETPNLKGVALELVRTDTGTQITRRAGIGHETVMFRETKFAVLVEGDRISVSPR